MATSTFKKAAWVAVGLPALWLVVVAVTSVVATGSTKQKLETSIGASLHGTATLQDADLALVRGFLEAHGLSVVHDDPLGVLHVDVASFRCDLPPLGLALFIKGCTTLTIDGLALDLSSLAVFAWKKPPAKAPIHADHVVLTNATLRFAGGALFPAADAIEVSIERAEAGETVFKSPLSFLFSLQTLGATIKLPAGITIRLDVKDGTLEARGTFLGRDPIGVPLTLPVRDVTWDAHQELQVLVQFFRDLATQLVERRIGGFLKSVF